MNKAMLIFVPGYCIRSHCLLFWVVLKFWWFIQTFLNVQQKSLRGKCIDFGHFGGQLVGLEYTLFGDDARDQCGRCDIKGWIPAANTRRSDTLFAHMRHLTVRSLFDHNLVAGGFLQIDRCERSRNVEWHIVMLAHDGNLICADFVGCVSVGDHTIGSDHHSGDVLQNAMRLINMKFAILRVESEMCLPYDASTPPPYCRRSTWLAVYRVPARKPSAVHPDCMAVFQCRTHALIVPDPANAAPLQAPSRIRPWPASRCCSASAHAHCQWCHPKSRKLHIHQSPDYRRYLCSAWLRCALEICISFHQWPQSHWRTIHWPAGSILRRQFSSATNR